MHQVLSLTACLGPQRCGLDLVHPLVQVQVVGLPLPLASWGEGEASWPGPVSGQMVLVGCGPRPPLGACQVVPAGQVAAVVVLLQAALGLTSRLPLPPYCGRPSLQASVCLAWRSPLEPPLVGKVPPAPAVQADCLSAVGAAAASPTHTRRPRPPRPPPVVWAAQGPRHGVAPAQARGCPCNWVSLPACTVR